MQGAGCRVPDLRGRVHRGATRDDDMFALSWEAEDREDLFVLVQRHGCSSAAGRSVVVLCFRLRGAEGGRTELGRETEGVEGEGLRVDKRLDGERKQWENSAMGATTDELLPRFPRNHYSPRDAARTRRVGGGPPSSSAPPLPPVRGGGSLRSINRAAGGRQRRVHLPARPFHPNHHSRRKP